MELSRQEYPALLTTVSPTQAVSILNDRIAYIGKVNSEVAAWLAERRRVEDLYVQGLKKLARPGGQTGNYGVFQTPWQGLLNSIEAIAESHDVLAKRIEADVERPLREFSNKNREMQRISTMKGNLASLAKDFDDAQRKSDKLQSSGKADSGKIAASLQKVQETSGPWESQAPYVFESLQALDESRVNHLRDALTQLQTHEIDILERSRNAATSTLEVILNVNTAEEISSFVARNSEGSPSLQIPRPGTAVTQPQPSRSFTNILSSLGHPSEETNSTREGESSSPAAARKRRTGTGLSGALGPLAPTDLEDRQSEISSIAPSTQTPTKAPAIPPSPAKKSTFGGLKRFGTVIGRKNKDPSSPKGEKPAPPERKTKSRLNPLRRNSTMADAHQRIPSPNASAVELGDSSAVQEPADISRTTSIDQSQSLSQTHAHTNGDSISSLSTEPLSNGSAPSPLSQNRQIRPPSTILEEGGPSVLDDITRAQQEADASAENNQHLNLDIRSSPIQEDSEAQNAAFSNVANVLRTQAAPPTRKQGTVRGRRDVRNTIFVPSGVTPDSVMPLPDPATFPSPPLGSHAEERAADTQSIRSAHSLTSLAPGATHKHPELTQPGLNASVIETVSTSFQQGQVEKAIVTGEIALAYNGTSPTGKEVIRLDNFAVLHKVAPNPQFVQQIHERSGEYSLDVASIPKPQVAFKYQVHLEDTGLAAHSPVLLTPLWKIEPHQASVILNYTWNTALPAIVSQVTLSNVVVVISIENAKATSCMSKPVGSFSAEKGSVYWRLGQVVLERNAPEQRVLARFATDGEAKAGTVEARWEISGEHAVGLGSKLGLSVKTEDVEKREATPDPFSDEAVNDTAAGYKPVALVKKLVSGTYQAT